MMNSKKWMVERKIGQKQLDEIEQLEFIGEIFEAIDDDGNGVMDMDEFIKALLSLSISQDITFARKIISVFKEYKIMMKNKNKNNYGQNKDDLLKEIGETTYSFKEFRTLLKKDMFTEKILKMLNKEVKLMKVAN